MASCSVLSSGALSLAFSQCVSVRRERQQPPRCSAAPPRLGRCAGQAGSASRLQEQRHVLFGSGRGASGVQRGLQKSPVVCGIFGLGVPELVVIAGVAAVLFGPKQLPELGKSLGKTVKSFQQVSASMSAASGFLRAGQNGRTRKGTTTLHCLV